MQFENPEDGYDDLNDVEPDDDENRNRNKVVVKHARYRRKKKKRPVKNCGALVLSLPRNLRLHGWSSERAAAALQTYGLQKPYKSSKSGPLIFADYHKFRLCSDDGCLAVIKRLPPHF